MNAAIGGHVLQRKADVATQLKESQDALDRRDEILADPEWWKDQLNTHDGAVAGAVDDQVCRIMSNLDRACNGEQTAIEAILNGLHLIQKQAIREATLEAESA